MPEDQPLLNDDVGDGRKPGLREGGVAGNLAFGLGSHFYMGYRIARAEAVAATERFLICSIDLG